MIIITIRVFPYHSLYISDRGVGRILSNIFHHFQSSRGGLLSLSSCRQLYGKALWKRLSDLDP